MKRSARPESAPTVGRVPSRSGESSSALSRHLLGRFSGSSSGPRVVCLGGLHGNEPAGVEALRRVLRRLARWAPPFRGELVCLLGNVAAWERGARFIDRDLNRMWTAGRIRTLTGAPAGNPPDDADGGRDGAPRPTGTGAPATAEETELRSLLAVFDEVLKPEEHGVFFLDLHTTSAESPPFLVLPDALRSRIFARDFALPVVLGLAEKIPGTLLDHAARRVRAAVGVEGGRRGLPASLEHLEGAIWSGLASAGCLRAEDLPADRSELRRHLTAAGRTVPPLFEVAYRHRIEDRDEFRMRPGFRNFDTVEAGELLAADRRGEIRAAEAARVFLPLYQRQGDDGFFLVRAKEDAAALAPRIAG